MTAATRRIRSAVRAPSSSPGFAASATRPALRYIIGPEMTLARMWPFQDVMAARQDVDYSVHVLGPYRADPDLIDSRPYVQRHLPTRRGPGEVWLVRGWSDFRVVAAAYLRRIPSMLWHESPGRTYEATSLRDSMRIRSRSLLLPQIFRAYRGRVLLAIGELAAERFAELAPGSQVHLLPYPHGDADALLAVGGERGTHATGGPELLFVGELSRRKGVDLLAQACEQLWQEGFEFGIRYAGRGPMASLARDHAARSSGRAEVLGHVDRDALVELYRTSDGLVLPSRWDGWGLVIHEALAAGLPVVVSDKCGAKMLCQGCGAIVEAGSKASLVEGLRWFLTLTGEERRALGARACARAADLTMDRIADALVRHARQALDVAVAKAALP